MGWALCQPGARPLRSCVSAWPHTALSLAVLAPAVQQTLLRGQKLLQVRIKAARDVHADGDISPRHVSTREIIIFLSTGTGEGQPGQKDTGWGAGLQVTLPVAL